MPTNIPISHLRMNRVHIKSDFLKCNFELLLTFMNFILVWTLSNFYELQNLFFELHYYGI